MKPVAYLLNTFRSIQESTPIWPNSKVKVSWFLKMVCCKEGGGEKWPTNYRDVYRKKTWREVL